MWRQVLPPVEAIHIATSNGAQFLGEQDSIGTLAVGKRADLVGSSDGRLLTFADGDGVMHLLDRETGELNTLAKPAECDRPHSAIPTFMKG